MGVTIYLHLGARVMYFAMSCETLACGAFALGNPQGSSQSLSALDDAYPLRRFGRLPYVCSDASIVQSRQSTSGPHLQSAFGRCAPTVAVAGGRAASPHRT